MNEQMLLIVILVGVFVFVFANRLRADLAALLIAALLGAAQFAGLGMLDRPGHPELAVKAIAGFSQPVVVTLISLFMITRILEKIGLTHWITGQLLRFGGNSERRLIALFATATALLSLFMNNVAAGALLLPSAMEASRKTGISPGKLLIPVSFGSLLGGAATYFTTANILASNLLLTAEPPLPPLNILAFTPTGGLMALAGIAFMATWGSRLLPNRASEHNGLLRRLTGQQLEDAYQINERLWMARVNPGSPLAGKTLAQAAFGEKLGITAPAMLRGGRVLFPLSPDQPIAAGDQFVVIGREDRVNSLLAEGMTVTRQEQSRLSLMGLSLLEVVTAPRSTAEGRTLKDLSFRRLYGYTALALLRRGRSYRTNVADIKLEPGDSLLLAGVPGNRARLARDGDFIILDPDPGDRPVNRGHALASGVIVITAVGASIAGVPIYLAMLAAAVLILLLGLLTMEEAYQAIEWQAIFLVAGMYSASIAMVETGLADRIGEIALRVVTPFGPLGLAAGAFLLSAALTQVMGGQVTVLITGPIAISAAVAMQINPHAIAVAAAIGCSISFLTPISHPVNIMMMGPGNYRPADFPRIGWPLALICFVVVMLGMILFWGL